MAKAKSVKKAAKKATPKRPATGPWKGPKPCKDKDICEYLKALGVWFTWFETDYKQLRIAMCNVEAQAFNGAGVSGKRFPPCSGGVIGDPIPPPQPPKWT